VRVVRLAAVVAALITVDGPYTAIAAARRRALGPDGLAFMLVMVGDVVGLAVLVAAAMIRIAISHTAGWHQFASWLSR
jgi:hypothetical protein